MKYELLYLFLWFLMGVNLCLIYVNWNALNTTLNLSYESPYISNVFPSQQCSGIDIGDMKIMRIPAKTGSMRPHIYSGDKVLVVNYDPSIDLVLGDVVANNGVLHRITAIDYRDNYYLMKGDNIRRPDSTRYNISETKYVVCGVLRGTI
jgi:hypothetical protein